MACELPLQAIAELLGVSLVDRQKIFDWPNEMITYDDPEHRIQPEMAAEILGYAMNLAEGRCLP